MKSNRSSVSEKALALAPWLTMRSVAAVRWFHWALPVSVIVITALVFAPLLQNEFVNWDDRVNLLENRYYRGLSWTHLQWMFTTFHNSLYRPLTWITLGADYLLWGMNASGYHLTSVLLHCAAALLFYFLSVRLLARAAPASDVWAVRFAAVFAALIFAIHPLRVEPVAWVSGRENVVAGPFFIATFICYLRAVDAVHAPSYRRWMVGAWVSYSLSLLGKGAGVTLPFALLILDVYPLRRLSTHPSNWFGSGLGRVWWEKVPFFFLALIAGLLAIFGKQQSRLMYGLDEYGLVERGVQTVYGLAFYLWKTVLPFELSPLYEIATLSPFEWPFILSTVILATLTGAVWILRRRWECGLASWIYYVVILLPYIGVAQNGPQVAADRYSYLACLTWAVLAGAALLYCRRARESGKIRQPIFALIPASAVLLVVALGFLTWQQTHIWRDSETLWRHALAINNNSFFAHHFLGTVLLVKGKSAEAIAQFRKSLAINPTYASAHAGLANALAEVGDLESAVAEYRKALELDGDSLEAHYSLARVLAKRGEADLAITHYRRALALNPLDADTHNNLGLLFAARADLEKAVEHFEAALRADPTYARAHFNLGRVYVRQGRLDAAVESFERALQLQPRIAEIHENLGRVLSMQGRKDQAAKHFEAALRILRSSQPSQ
jgi:protein O-mannosyl-transferase